MRLGLFQTPSPAGDILAGVSVVRDAMAQAADAGVDMLVLPELFLPGYGASTRDVPPEWSGVLPEITGLCREYRLALTIGVPDYDKGAVFNTAVALSAEGLELGRYRKLQLFGDDEAQTFARGDRYCVFDLGGVRFGLLICYDVEFPEHVRALARLGAQVILVPTANMMPFVTVNQILVPARAAENGVTIVYANYCGTEGALVYTGLSGIFGPDGYLLAGKGRGPGLCVADLPGDWREHDLPLSTQLNDLVEVKP